MNYEIDDDAKPDNSDNLRTRIELLQTAMFNAINEINRLTRGEQNYTRDALKEQILKINERLVAAYNAEHVFG